MVAQMTEIQPGTDSQKGKPASREKLVVATAPLCGCFGCHMSLLDIDERILDLVEVVEFDRSPITDIKTIGKCDIGLIEGGVANAHNIHDLREFRANCDILVAMGSCAITGGIPAMRNQFDLKECLEEAYIHGIGVENPHVPNDVEIPLLLDKVHPIHEVVRVDYFLPGCPPSADMIWKFLTDVVAGNEVSFPYSMIHYD
jgi:NAD-reducing hydrogenase small subunit